MKTQTLEQELEGFKQILTLNEYEIWAKGRKRILYNTNKKKITHRYYMHKEREIK